MILNSTPVEQTIDGDRRERFIKEIVLSRPDGSPALPNDHDIDDADDDDDDEPPLAADDNGMPPVGGYGPDVLDEEPPPADHPRLSAPNCVITPHIGSRTYESVPRQAMKSLTNLINALSGEGECNCANGVI